MFSKYISKTIRGAHTHLYSKESINYFTKKYKLKIIGQWWFGQDFLDLKRSLINSIKKETSKNFLNAFQNLFGSHIDELQKVLDKKFISSEVHIILRK